MPALNYHEHDYVRQLNQWHLELAMLRDLVNHVLTATDGPEWLTSAAHIAADRLSYLVESCPFPDEAQLSDN